MIDEKTPYRPEDVGYAPSRLDALDAHLLRLIDGGKLQSANYRLSRDGKVFASRAHGRLSFRAEDAREARPDTIQRIASITKLFTAAAVFRLAEDGIIRAGQSAGSVLDEMSATPFGGITIAQLLSHTSGIAPDPGCFGVTYGKTAWDFIRMLPDKPWLEAALSVGTRNKPGTEWMYNTFGYVILGEIISRASGVNCHEYIRREIIEPCGLSDTFFPASVRAEAGQESRTAIAARMNAKNAEDERTISSLLEREPLPPSGQEARLEAVPRTGGAIWSTAADLNRFGVMLMNSGSIDGRRVIGRRTALRMTENYTLPEIRDWCWGSGGAHRDYALGPDTRRTADSLYGEGTYFHEGMGPCALIIDPKERLVASWFVPSKGGAWIAEAVYNTAAIIWSGLE